MTPVVQLGVPQLLTEDVVYGLPIPVSQGFAADIASDLEVSMDGSTWIGLTVGADGSFFSSAPFIRCHGDDGTIICKAY